MVRKKKKESVNFTVVRINRETLKEIREVADNHGWSVPTTIDDMLNIYLAVLGISRRKEDSDARPKFK